MPSKQIDDVDDEIRALLRRKAETVRVPDQHLRHTLGRSDRRLGRNVFVLLVSVALAGYGIVAGVRSLQRSATPRPAGSPQPPVAPTPSSSGTATWVHVPGDISGFPLGIAADEATVWIATGGNTPFPPPGTDSDPGAQMATLSRVEPGTGAVTDTVEVGGAGDIRVVAAFGDAWVLRPGYDQVIRFDGTSLSQVATIAVSDPVAGAGDGSSLWIVSGRTGVVSRIDPGTNQVAGTVDPGIDATGPEVDENGYPIPPYNGTPVVGIAAFDGSVWVHGRSQLVQIDGTTGSVGSTVTADGQIEGLAAGDGGVWISLCAPVEAPPCSWQVAEVDPGSGTIVQTIPVGDWKSDPDPGSEGSVGRVDLAMDGGEVWASIAINYSGWAKGKIVEIDPAAGGVVRTVPVDGGNGTNDIAHTSDIYGPPVVQDGVLWIINIENDEVVRLDLEP